MILKASEENFVEKNMVQNWYHLPNIVICTNYQTGELNSVQHNFNIDCLEGINGSYYILPIDGLQCLLNTSTSAIARAACQYPVAHGCGLLCVNSIGSMVCTRNGR